MTLRCPEAAYHRMARGNGRQEIVRDDVDRDGLQQRSRLVWPAKTPG